MGASFDRIARRVARHSLIANGLIAVLLTVLTWAPGPTPTPGLDPSWAAGLAMALVKHLQFGPSFNFTFGPLGTAANQTLFFGSTALLGLAYIFVITLLLAWLLIEVLRENFSIVTATLVTYAVLAIVTRHVDGGDLVLAPGILLAFVTIRCTDPRVRCGLVCLLGGLAGLQLLVKFSGGLVLVGMVVVVVVHDRRFRSAMVAVASVGLVFLVGWEAAGQGFGNIATFFRASAAIATGYAAAMQISGAQSTAYQERYAILVIYIIVCFLAVDQWRRSRAEQWATAAVFVGWGWIVLKESFVRSDSGHVEIFFALALIVVAGCRMPGAVRGATIAGLAVCALLASLVAGTSVAEISPLSNARSLLNEMENVADSGRRTRLISRYRTDVLNEGDGLPPSILALLRHETVAIEPLESIIAWAYPALEWDPEPILQGYTAYTSYLDQLDAKFLEGPRAPERILRQIVAIDDRDPYFDPPAAQVQLLCNYRQLLVVGQWQVLGKVPDRCSNRRFLSRQRVSFGQPVAVPDARAGQMVVAQFSLTSPITSRLRAVLLKPPLVEVSLRVGTSTTYRFISGTAGDDHILQTPSTLGYSLTFTPSAVGSMTFSGGGWSAGQGEVTVTFYAVDLAGDGQAPPAAVPDLRLTAAVERARAAHAR